MDVTSQQIKSYAAPGEAYGYTRPASQGIDIVPRQRDSNTNSSSNASDRAAQAAEQRQLDRLKRDDRSLRAHELAHLSNAGRYARGGANFAYTRGPDGRLYATSGEVKIDASEVAGDPQATLEKADTIRRAALAPIDPSAQDRLVAARAVQMAAQARLELAMQGHTSAAGSASRVSNPNTLYEVAGIGQPPGNALNIYV